ncbi:hypothetical protein ABIB99_008650 [Bradyrhizobium sp. LA6.1]|jgi:hypothetical protein
MTVWIYDQGKELKVFATEEAAKVGSMKTIPRA